MGHDVAAMSADGMMARAMNIGSHASTMSMSLGVVSTIGAFLFGCLVLNTVSDVAECRIDHPDTDVVYTGGISEFVGRTAAIFVVGVFVAFWTGAALMPERWTTFVCSLMVCVGLVEYAVGTLLVAILSTWCDIPLANAGRDAIHGGEYHHLMAFSVFVLIAPIAHAVSNVLGVTSVEKLERSRVASRPVSVWVKSAIVLPELYTLVINFIYAVVVTTAFASSSSEFSKHYLHGSSNTATCQNVTAQVGLTLSTYEKHFAENNGLSTDAKSHAFNLNRDVLYGLGVSAAVFGGIAIVTGVLLMLKSHFPTRFAKFNGGMHMWIGFGHRCLTVITTTLLSLTTWYLLHRSPLSACPTFNMNERGYAIATMATLFWTASGVNFIQAALVRHQVGKSDRVVDKEPVTLPASRAKFNGVYNRVSTDPIGEMPTIAAV